MRTSIKHALERYAKDYTEPGGFLRAVLENRLRESLERADRGNLDDLVEIVTYCINEIPDACWGSPERVKEWLANIAYRCTCSADDRPCSHLHAEGHGGCQRPAAFILTYGDRTFNEPFCKECGVDAVACLEFLPSKHPLKPENL